MSAPEKSLLTILKTAHALDADVHAFLIDREARGLSPRTLEYYAAELGHLRAFLRDRGIADTVAISANDLRAFFLDLGKRCSPGGVHAAYRAARAFLNWYASEYEPDGWRNPIKKVRPPKVPDKTLDPVPLADVAAMLKTCEGKTFTDLRDKALIMALLDTGARASEFCALDVDDVDLRTGAVHIRRGKGGKARVVFLGAKSRKALTAYLRLRTEGGPLWIGRSGNRLAPGGLVSLLRRRAELAGVPAPRPHAFRRAFALLSLRGGVDLVSLQRLLGHADLSVLRRYLKQGQSDLQEAHRRAGPVDKYL